MTLQAQATYHVPEATAAGARAIFPEGNLVMRMYDELGLQVHDADFAGLFPSQGQPAATPARLALVTLLQFWEGLTDRQAADVCGPALIGSRRPSRQSTGSGVR